MNYELSEDTKLMFFIETISVSGLNLIVISWFGNSYISLFDNITSLF